MPQASRFVDRGVLLASFARECWAVCPKCSNLLVVSSDLKRGFPVDFDRSKATCTTCTFRASSDQEQWSGPLSPRTREPMRFGGPFDPFFGFPLWLRTSCCGETLWAYNEIHLNRLREYVCATIREKRGFVYAPRLHASVFSRLPKWVCLRKNRDAVLTCINRLEEMVSNRRSYRDEM